MSIVLVDSSSNDYCKVDPEAGATILRFVGYSGEETSTLRSWGPIGIAWYSHLPKKYDGDVR